MLVEFSKKAKKDIHKIPANLQDKLFLWIKIVNEFGLMVARQSKGFHDEALKGERHGQRSIRLNIAYRAIYILNKDDQVEFVEIIEVNKHEY